MSTIPIAIRVRAQQYITTTKKRPGVISISAAMRSPKFWATRALAEGKIESEPLR